MKIFLVRHAEPDIRLKGWTNVLEHRKQLRKYYRAGIVFDKTKFGKVLNIINTEAIFYSSNLPRAVLTAKQIVPEERIIQNKLFQEIELPAVRIPIKANYFLWRNISRLFWIIKLSKKENFLEIKNKIITAADKLMKDAETHDVVLFGHGLMNLLLALRLKSQGWKGRIPLINNYWNIIILKQ